MHTGTDDQRQRSCSGGHVAQRETKKHHTCNVALVAGHPLLVEHSEVAKLHGPDGERRVLGEPVGHRVEPKGVERDIGVGVRAPRVGEGPQVGLGG